MKFHSSHMKFGVVGIVISYDKIKEILSQYEIELIITAEHNLSVIRYSREVLKMEPRIFRFDHISYGWGAPQMTDSFIINSCDELIIITNDPDTKQVLGKRYHIHVIT